ncbi:2-nitropropane dioxygenase [Micrococcaceae bacterium Sec5.7]
MSTITITRSARCNAYRRPSVLETAATRVGAGLVRWAEQRRVIPEGWAERQHAAIRRREELNELRSGVMGAAHSGLIVWR